MTTKKKLLSEGQLNLLLKEVCGIAEQAGKRLEKRRRKLESLTITSKEAQGVVSEADVEAEKFIIKKLKPLIGSATFLAEESAFLEFGGKPEAYRHFLDHDYAWIIDPLDGTTNFLNNLDYYCVCICLVKKGVPILGLVYRPSSGEFFTALKGKGAFLSAPGKRRRKLEIGTAAKKLKNSLLVTGFACEKGAEFDQEFMLFLKMMKNSRGIRRMGSAALDLCLVAQGIFDGFWERGLAPWDVAAAGLICKEAGAVVTNYESERFHPFQSTIVASNRKISKELLCTINS